ncbi:MAG TPA: Spo0E family sporulation regulatory protein-aspartic acid phosphatase [Pseudobacteroides sp.]|nr:Spo0E family sporulation regulatory protein-aspartic acid phosphatase [Pseudobacteroides sp.]
MHIRLNKLIEINNFDLQSHPVQQYSRRLDRVLTFYNKKL